MNENQAPENGIAGPPSFSPVTFYNFVDTHRRTLPSRIDKSIMQNVAGGDRPKIMGALRFFGLTDGPNDRPTARFEVLRDVGDDTDAVKQVWAKMLLDAYAPALAGLELASATQAQIDERFREHYKISGDTIRKAVAFFLALARQADVSLSTYVKKTRQRTGGGGGSKPRAPRAAKTRAERGTQNAGGSTAPLEKPAGSSAMVVRFKSGGSATLYVNADWVAISKADRDALIGWIDAMKTYADANPAPENNEAQETP